MIFPGIAFYYGNNYIIYYVIRISSVTVDIFSTNFCTQVYYQVHYYFFPHFQALSSIPGLLPIRKEFIELLQHSHELEAASIEHNLAATLISLQLGRHESSIEQLLQHSRELMELVAHQRELIKGQGAELPPELTRRCSELRERQEMLTVQVAAERQLPVIASSGTQVKGENKSWEIFQHELLF